MLRLVPDNQCRNWAKDISFGNPPAQIYSIRSIDCGSGTPAAEKKQFTRITPIRFHPSDRCERLRIRIALCSGSRPGTPQKITRSPGSIKVKSLLKLRRETGTLSRLQK